MDGFFDETDSTLLLLLFLTTLTKEENDITEEKLEDGLDVSIPEPVLEEAICYIHKSSNRKRLKPKTVYF
ncbi:MAG TPA: hypothetical protein VEB00_13385 [Clostridia bacterium]|nr:hypothetical protein [Clostridia bacterium]